MSTNVRIKQKALFKKKLEMKDIVALTGLAYGVIDDNYRLIRNEMAAGKYVCLLSYPSFLNSENNASIFTGLTQLSTHLHSENLYIPVLRLGFPSLCLFVLLLSSIEPYRIPYLHLH